MSINWEEPDVWHMASATWRERAEESEEKLGILTGKYVDLFHENEGLVASVDRLIGSLMAIEEVCRERADAAIKERP